MYCQRHNFIWRFKFCTSWYQITVRIFHSDSTTHNKLAWPVRKYIFSSPNALRSPSRAWPISVFSTNPCKSHVTQNTINDGNTQTLSPHFLGVSGRFTRARTTQAQVHTVTFFCAYAYACIMCEPAFRVVSVPLLYWVSKGVEIRSTSCCTK